MSLLLDTHVLLWALTEPGKLGTNTRSTIEDPGNEVWISCASLWEVAVKYQLGKLPLPGKPAALFPPYLEASGFLTLAVMPEHALAVADLPRHHRDPFDRMLAVQASVERHTLVTLDPVFDRYGIATLRADR